MGGTYRPKPRAAFNTVEWPMPLGTTPDGWTVELFAKQEQFRGQVRYFSISVWAFRENDRFEVEAVDTCDGVLHRHRMRRSAPDDRQIDRHHIMDLNAGDEHIVDREFDVQYGWMLDNWEQLLRRWANE